ncbi:LysR family transcriptional regulator [uncultured Sphaerochaeta sp.]|uniref:LysR family transcriptional regulator n=1 Tax=uncultured Sphaerochaeta sp. TaxID=886478 RepID=UPI002A0A9EBC|nr:LysR family transcriptional regulator [uncultured Sphaerochaeta sp.]
MTIRDFRIFCEVADTLSMSKAAERLDCAQPTISHVITEIEAEYGVKLFERLSRRLYLTSDGYYLLSRSKSILDLYDEVDANLGSYTQTVFLRMGATITVGSSIMPKLISSYETSHSNSIVKVVVDNTHVIETLLLENRLDLALVEGTVASTDIIVEPLILDELVLVLSPEYPFPANPTCTVADLAGKPFIFREEGSGTRERFVRFLSENKTSVVEKWICHSSDSIINAVKSGQGFSVISERLVREDLKQGLLRSIAIEGADFKRFFSLVYHKDKFFTPSIESLVKEIKTFFEI